MPVLIFGLACFVVSKRGNLHWSAPRMQVEYNRPLQHLFSTNRTKLTIKKPTPWPNNNSGRSKERIIDRRGTHHDDFLLPWAVVQYLHPRVQERLDANAVRTNCLFDALSRKQKRNAVQWESKRYFIWQCFGGCGGLGDRMKGIISVFLHAVAIGYEFIIDWAEPTALYPDILVPSTLLNWTGNPHSVRSTSLRIMDQVDNPFDLCEWRNFKSVKIQTNDHPIPKSCDHGDVKIREILLSQSHTTSCLRTATKQWRGGTQCMGCIFWYLFRIGGKLKDRLALQLKHLQDWKEKRNLQGAFSIGMHVRAGDSHMRAGQGREASDIASLVARLEACASNFSTAIGSKHKRFFLIIVSDSERVKGLIGKWDWLQVYSSPTSPIHIDRHQNLAKEKMVDAALSVFVDMFLLALQDALLLSGTSGYGYLAQSVGLFDDSNSFNCIT